MLATATHPCLIWIYNILAMRTAACVSLYLASYQFSIYVATYVPCAWQYAVGLLNAVNTSEWEHWNVERPNISGKLVNIAVSKKSNWLNNY